MQLTKFSLRSMATLLQRQGADSSWSPLLEQEINRVWEQQFGKEYEQKKERWVSDPLPSGLVAFVMVGKPGLDCFAMDVGGTDDARSSKKWNKDGRRAAREAEANLKANSESQPNRASHSDDISQLIKQRNAELLFNRSKAQHDEQRSAIEYMRQNGLQTALLR